jgi:hypothetical protein
MTNYSVELMIPLIVRATSDSKESAEDALSVFLVWLVENQNILTRIYDGDRDSSTIIETRFEGSHAGAHI